MLAAGTAPGGCSATPVFLLSSFHQLPLRRALLEDFGVKAQSPQLSSEPQAHQHTVEAVDIGSDLVETI